MSGVPTPEQIAAIKAATEPIIVESQIYCWCAVAVLIWEFLVTTPSEISLIWPAPWTPMKVLYFLNRYLALPFMIVVGYLFTSTMSAESCNRVFQFEPYSLVTITFLCDTILSIRTYALWGKNKFLGAFLALVVCGELVVQAWAAQGGAAVPLQMLGIPGCIWSSTAKKMNAFFAVSSFVVLLTFVLTTVRIVMMWHKTGRSTLLVTLLRDGALYFGIVFAVSLLNLISFVTETPKGNPALHSPLAEVITSIMCTRIILATRRYGSPGDATGAVGSPSDLFSFKRTNQGQRSQAHGTGTYGTHTLPGAIQVSREVTVTLDTHDPSTVLNEKRPNVYTSPSSYSHSSTPNSYVSPDPNNPMELRSIRIQERPDRPDW